MKAYPVLLIIVFCLTTKIFPQLQFTPHTITDSLDGARSVYAIDVDSDGDIDVLSASSGDDKIAWYENDGDENFTSHTITTNADLALSVYATDVDGDGDIDALSASFADNKIAWYENDGNENFTSITIATSAIGPNTVYAVDVDGDGDMDVLSASEMDNKIAWYENDGNENFTPHTITTSANYALCVYAIDLDGDGDMDVLSASANDNKIAWYENDGNENFTPHTITTNTLYAKSVYAVDVAGDGDMDVLSASVYDDKIAWYENDGNENFTSHTITTSADAAWSVYAADVDGDGDVDVLSASFFDNKIAWYENDGDENFTPHIITTDVDGARSVYAIDVDSDGDTDVLSASLHDGKIVWYENPLMPDTLRVPGDYATVQAAIDAAINGDIVLVADSTYYENINFRGKAITVASHFILDSNETHIENTIINGSQPTYPDSGSVVTLNSGEDTTSVLCGFTITGGTGTVLMPGVIRGGGGINCSGGKICHNKIINNTVANYFSPIGGAIETGPPGSENYVIIDYNIIQSNFVSNSSFSGNGGGITFTTSGRICHNIIRNNVVSSQLGESFGGGLVVSFINNISVLVKDNIIINNKAITSSTSHDGVGGGLVFFQDSVNTFLRVTGNVIAFNEIQSNFRALGSGVAFSAANGDVEFVNNLIYNNYFNGLDNCLGGGIYTRSSNVKIIGNTITGNKASYGGGYFSKNTDSTFLMNNIFYCDTSTISNSEINIEFGAAPTLVYNDIQGGWTGTGNIDTDPFFVDTLYNLADSSLCIGAGTDSIEISGTWYYAPSFDFDGDPRPNPPNCLPDIGAQESPLCEPDTISTKVKILSSEIPNEFSLKQNYPNPFNPSTKIRYTIAKEGFVTLKVYDVLGNEISTLVNKEQPADNYVLTWNAANFPSGVYFYQLRAGDFFETKKMILLK